MKELRHARIFFLVKGSQGRSTVRNGACHAVSVGSFATKSDTKSNPFEFNSIESCCLLFLLGPRTSRVDYTRHQSSANDTICVIRQAPN